MYILPVPRKMELRGETFDICPGIVITLGEGCNFDNLEAARVLQQEIQITAGFRAPIAKTFSPGSGKYIFINKGNSNTDSSNKESYKLDITPENIIITGSGDAGVLYGVQTLRQIIRTSSRRLECVSIDDSPYFGTRGFYIDASRGKVPTLETLMRLADMAAFYKLNHLQLYIEHTFAFRNWSEVWSVTDPITAEEILLLDEYCAKRHIELVPSLSTFGHMYELLKTYSYNHLCELEDSLDTEFRWKDRMGHHTIDVSNDQSIALVKEAIDELVPLFSSDKFNICADETFDLGMGKNRELAEKYGKGRLYVDFLNKIIGIVKSHNKKVMFWGDVMVSHPELMSEIDRDVICLDWDYAPTPYQDLAKIVLENKMEQYMCTGTWGWNSLMNKMSMSYTNIFNFADLAVKYGATGMLNTDWGDCGHVNFLANSIPGMITGAAFSWNPEKKDNFDDINRKISRIHFKDAEERLVSLLAELSRQQIINYGEAISWQEWDYIDEKLIKLTEEEMHSMYKRSVEIRDEIADYMGKLPCENSIDAREYLVSADGICLINSLALIMKKYVVNLPVESLIDSPWDLAVKFEYWLEDYKEVWRMRNKESELYRIRNIFMKICKVLRKMR